MQIILLVLFLGTSINVANTHPHNVQEVNAAIVDQFKNPVITQADYSKLNK